MKLFNMMIPAEWIDQLKKIARSESVKRNDDVSVAKIIREAIQEKWGIKDAQKKDN